MSNNQDAFMRLGAEITRLEHQWRCACAEIERLRAVLERIASDGACECYLEDVARNALAKAG